MVDTGGAISLGAAGGISQLTGDVTAGPGSGSVADTLVGTNNVNTVVGNLPAVATNVVRRSATAQAAPGETTVFVGSTASQTITMPNTGTYTDLVYRIVNDSTVSVTIAGGVNSISVNGVIAGSFIVPSNTSYDFVWDGTGVWQCMAISQNGGGGGLTNFFGQTNNVTITSGTTLVTTPSLAVGTWLLHGEYDITMQANAADTNYVQCYANLGTALGVMTAPQAGATYGPGVITTNYVRISLSFTAIIVITTAGTVLFQASKQIMPGTVTSDITWECLKIA